MLEFSILHIDSSKGRLTQNLFASLLTVLNSLLSPIAVFEKLAVQASHGIGKVAPARIAYVRVSQ